MKPIYFRIVTIPTQPAGNYRSLPSQVGSSFPRMPALPPRPLEHPQDLSTTVPVSRPHLEPVNDSILATVRHL